MNEARIDKWMWAVRIFKTRTIAAEACKRAHQHQRRTGKGCPYGEAGRCHPGAQAPVTYSFKVLQTIEKRVGAKLVAEMMENVTTPEQYELLEMSRVSGFVNRAKGTGRPTKKTAGVWKNLQNRNFWMISTLNSILRKSKNKGKIMSERIIKWGFIGCGEVTKYKSGPAFQKIENSEVVAVMSRNGDKAKTYAKERGIPKWYDDAQELIDDEEVNAVYIATPPSSHATYAIMSMKAGKPVYIEKPMAVTYEECCRINRISQETGIPCFVAYYRRYLPYFLKVKSLVEEGHIGNVINIQIRFAQPPRDLDHNKENLPWRVQPDIAGGGYFYDLAPHQIDLLQEIFGCILEASGYKSNRGRLYPAEDTLSACFQFDSGLVGSGSWCFVAHESAREDRIEIIGDKGMICFSVFTYDPIALHTERGREEIIVENPTYVQQPLIQAVVDHLLGKSVCGCDGESATLTNWVMDKILNKL